MPDFVPIPDSAQTPQKYDAVIGQPDQNRRTDAVLGGRQSPHQPSSTPRWSWGYRYETADNQHSLYKLLRQCLDPQAPDHAIFCQLTPDFQFTRSSTAKYAPRSQAHVIHTEHQQVAQLWGFRGDNPQVTHFQQIIWYNLFYFQTQPLRQLLSSLQAGFSYGQLPARMQRDWDYHFATAFSRCRIESTDHRIMAHVAQFHPRTYAIAYSYWQTQYQLDVPPARQLQLQESAIDAVIALANYYLWFQMKL
ncbi:hypothetical protein IQ266_06625 [filamentous cyanobacterium LEGE 11480]|uniref:Uncharacterized protein n=1 Tax=Romeriopsis navalis LEGE 11480 TaxID=2777977 RepID=A0A928VN35_9CYAN|nr:hypothetical protein [Romeriopsis navalis]MBE9029437.1 hypothetical protein [Romeriopsis navalis LEGE 11480]